MSVAKLAPRIIRLPDVYGKNGLIPVGRSKFYDEYIKTGRLRLVPLGKRARGAVVTEVEQIVDEIIAERDITERDNAGRDNVT